MVLCRSDLGAAAPDCAALLAFLSEKRHLPAQYEAAVVYVLGDSGLKVDIKPLEAAITRLRSRSEELQLFYKMRELAVACGRPPLLDLQRPRLHLHRRLHHASFLSRSLKTIP